MKPKKRKGKALSQINTENIGEKIPQQATDVENGGNTNAAEKENGFVGDVIQKEPHISNVGSRSEQSKEAPSITSGERGGTEDIGDQSRNGRGKGKRKTITFDSEEFVGVEGDDDAGWLNGLEDKLLDLYEACPFLYDKNVPAFRQKYKKEMAYEHFAKLLHVTGRDSNYYLINSLFLCVCCAITRWCRRAPAFIFTQKKVHFPDFIFP